MANKDIKDIALDNIIISKPKKIDNTYICPIYYQTKKNKLLITFNNIILLSTKPLQQRNEFFIYIKNKSYNNFIYDLNTLIIDIVKNKSVLWFNNNMNIDLVDDYYTNTLIYDKKYGDVIRLKCIGNEQDINDYIMKKNNITIHINQIRFYKQKFILECEILKCETINYNINDTLINEDDILLIEDDIPLPNEDDIYKIKNEYLETINIFLNKIKISFSLLESKINNIEKLKFKLINTLDIDNIIKICNDLEKICE